MSQLTNLLSTIILAIIPLGTYCQMGGSNGFNPDPRFVEQMTALNYGDACNYENEQARHDFATKLTSTDMRDAKIFEQTVITKNLLFCNGMKLLMCDKQSQKCQCGDSGNQGLSMSTYKESNYVPEMRGNQTMCKMQVNAYCAPIDMFRSQESQCVTGATCTSTIEGGPCTSRTLASFFYNNQNKSKKELADETFMGKICHCKMMSGPVNNQMGMANTRNNGPYQQSPMFNPNQHHPATAKPFAKLIVQKREAPTRNFHLGEMFHNFLESV